MSDKAVPRARATPAETAERVERIADMMRHGEWVRGATAPLLAEEWALATSTVEALAAEASRIVARELGDPAKLQTDVAQVLLENLHRASAAKEFGDVAKLGDVVTKIMGARAPEKHDHTHRAATSYAALSDADAIAWLDDKIAQLQAERARRLAHMNAVPALEE